jgi:hypothetical protein
VDITEEAVLSLANCAKNIREIVGTINSIAEQTNLLTLNAAILDQIQTGARKANTLTNETVTVVEKAPGQA